MHNVQRFWRGIIVMVLVTLAVMLATGGQIVYAQENLYQEGFENGQSVGWELESGWSVEEETGHVLTGTGHFWARSNQVYDGDYALSFRLKVSSSTIHLVFNLNDAGRYFIAFDSQRSQLNKQHWPDRFELDLASGNTPHSLNNWHQIEIVVRDHTSEFLVDGVSEWKYTDAQPLDSGSFAFETLDDAQAYIDDVVVSPGGTSPSNTPVAVSDLAGTRLGGPLDGLGYDIRRVPGATEQMYVTDAAAGVHISSDGVLTWMPSRLSRPIHHLSIHPPCGRKGQHRSDPALPARLQGADGSKGLGCAGYSHGTANVDDQPIVVKTKWLRCERRPSWSMPYM